MLGVEDIKIFVNYVFKEALNKLITIRVLDKSHILLVYVYLQITQREINFKLTASIYTYGLIL